MTEYNPPAFLQAATVNHPAEMHRRSIIGERRAGILTPGALLVEESDTPAMTVKVASGRALVAGSENTYQGHYLVENRGELAGLVISPADGTNPRIDLVVARVQDEQYSGSTNSWAIEVVTGTAAASPTVPTVPENSLVLAQIAVAASETTINTADITDLRMSNAAGPASLANLNGSSELPSGKILCTSTTRPTSGLYQGMEIYETDTSEVYRYDGSSWDFVSRDGDGIWQTFTPNIGGLLFSSESARYTRVGDLVTIEYRGTVSGVDGAGSFITIDLPLAMANGVVEDILAWGQWIYQDVNTVYTARPRVNSSTVVSSRPQHGDGLGNSAWNSATPQPVLPAAGDILSFAMTYETT